LTNPWCYAKIPKQKGGDMTEAYCVKCKSKKEMKDAKEVEMKNGRKAMKGKCPDCGTGMYRIMGK
jgi:NAD-dependent SIR2 family protein deacetylase